MAEEDDEHITIDRIEVALKTAIAIGPNAPAWIFEIINEQLCSRLARELASKEHRLDLDPEYNECAESTKSESNRQDEFLTAVQVGRILRVSPETLRLLRHAGRGPPHSKRMVRRWASIYSRKDLEEWIQIRTVATESLAHKRGRKPR